MQRATRHNRCVVSRLGDETYDLPTPTTPRGARTRERILAAAEDVFGEMGYEQASVTAITQAAGVAQGTFYVYFPSKHAAFVELIKDFASRVRSAIASRSVPVVNAGGKRADVERAGLEAFLEFCADHTALYRVMREAMIFAPETHRWYYESFADAYVDAFARVSDGGTPSDPRALAYVMIGIADWMGLKWIVWEGKTPPAAALDEVALLLDRGLTGVMEAAKPGRKGRGGRRT